MPRSVHQPTSSLLLICSLLNCVSRMITTLTLCASDESIYTAVLLLHYPLTKGSQNVITKVTFGTLYSVSILCFMFSVPSSPSRFTVPQLSMLRASKLRMHVQQPNIVFLVLFRFGYLLSLMILVIVT